MRSPRTTSSRRPSTPAPRRSTTSTRPSSVQSEATDVVAVRTSLQDAGIDYDSADVEFVASLEIPVDAAGAAKVMHLVDALEDLDDVQDVFTNVDIPADVLAELESADA